MDAAEDRLPDHPAPDSPHGKLVLLRHGETEWSRTGRHTGLTDIAVWADPTRALSVAVVSSGKPSGHKEAKRYPQLLDRINAEMARV